MVKQARKEVRCQVFGTRRGMGNHQLKTLAAITVPGRLREGAADAAPLSAHRGQTLRQPFHRAAREPENVRWPVCVVDFLSMCARAFGHTTSALQPSKPPYRNAESFPCLGCT